MVFGRHVLELLALWDSIKSGSILSFDWTSIVGFK